MPRPPLPRCARRALVAGAGAGDHHQLVPHAGGGAAAGPPPRRAPLRLPLLRRAPRRHGARAARVRGGRAARHGRARRVRRAQARRGARRAPRRRRRRGQPEAGARARRLRRGQGRRARGAGGPPKVAALASRVAWARDDGDWARGRGAMNLLRRGAERFTVVA